MVISSSCLGPGILIHDLYKKKLQLYLPQLPGLASTIYFSTVILHSTPIVLPFTSSSIQSLHAKEYLERLNASMVLLYNNFLDGGESRDLDPDGGKPRDPCLKEGNREIDFWIEGTVSTSRNDFDALEIVEAYVSKRYFSHIYVQNALRLIQ
eukprot:Gb_38216 [translate_table: standard]